MALMQKKIQIRSHFQKFIEAPIRAPKISRNMSDSRSFFFFHWFVRLELDNLMTREKSFCFLFNYYKSFSPKKILDRLLRTRDEYVFSASNNVFHQIRRLNTCSL